MKNTQRSARIMNPKMDHYSRQLYYCNILLIAQVVDLQVQSGDSSTQIPVSQDIQPVEVQYGLELAETLVSINEGIGARPEIPKMTPPDKISTEQQLYRPLWLKNSKNEQQFLWPFKMSLPDRLIRQMSQSQDLVMWIPLTLQKIQRVLNLFFE